jgi:hypothetical protein
MEAAFGADFSDVTVQEDGGPAALDAVALTRGSQIAFGPGDYEPHSPEGLEVIGHELAHVLQQRAGRVRGTGMTEDPALETAADEAGRRAAHGEQVGSSFGGATSATPAGAQPAAGPVAQPMIRRKDPNRGKQPTENPYGPVPGFRSSVPYYGDRLAFGAPAGREFAPIPDLSTVPAPVAQAQIYANIPGGAPVAQPQPQPQIYANIPAAGPAGRAQARGGAAPQGRSGMGAVIDELAKRNERKGKDAS